MKHAWAYRFAIPMAMVCVTVVGAQKPAGMGFFITSVGSGKGADLGGLEGADKHCQQLAQAAGAGGRTWRAYLSAGGDKPVHAKDRIGSGPWTNAKGVVVATSVADLHSDANKLSKENSLTEKGEVVNGRGDKPNRHDILTGSGPDGSLLDGQTCSGPKYPRTTEFRYSRTLRNPRDPRRSRGCVTRKGVRMKALRRMALILTPLLAAPTGRSAAGVTRVPQLPGIRCNC